MKRVLLTGVGGFVGAHMLAHIMKETDWHVVAVDSFRHKGKTDRVADLLDVYPEYRQRMTVVTHDLTAPISDVLDRRIGHIDYVLSIASESHVDRSIEEPRPFIENNVSLILTLLEWARARKETDPIEKFLHTSTDEVYGPAYDVDHKEGAPHRPSNPYSASKSAQEAICYGYWRTYGLPIMITNTMNMIGQLQDTEKFVPKIIKAIQEDGTVKVHVSPEGTPGSRYYLHARNQCDAQVYILNNIEPTQYPSLDLERFNIVSDDEIDNLQMVDLVADILGKKPKVELQNFHESRPGHDLRYGLDGTKMKELGWAPKVSLDEGLKTTVNWYKEHKEWLQ